MSNRDLPIIGSTELIRVKGEHGQFLSKIDTGAANSSIWASDIQIEDDNSLSFVLFAPESPHYSGNRHNAKHYGVHSVRSSNGSTQVRYWVNLEITMGRKTFSCVFHLSDRSANAIPILIGNSALAGRFLVDCAKNIHKKPQSEPGPVQRALDQELAADPKAFHDKHKPGSKSVNIKTNP